MNSVDVLVIGAGQAGLAVSHCLDRLGIDHLVLERGRVAERWLSERWDSLRLLTPNWMSRLPGWSYGGDAPDGYMAAAEVASYLTGYAGSFAAPVRIGTSVRSVRRDDVGYVVATDKGSWRARAVVLATGDCDKPAIPAMAGRISPGILQLTPNRYRNPDLLPKGGILVVGASATGVQLAEEIHSSGRRVTLSVGSHVRLPRLWRDRDIMWWLDRAGILDEQIADMDRNRLPPSLQLVGRQDRRSIDLDILHRQGIRMVGRTLDADGFRIALRDDLADTIAAAQRKLDRLLTRLGAEDGPPPITLPRSPTEIDLRREGIATILWATGYRRDYSWLHVPVLDGAGEIVHHGGITPAPGLYVLGLRFLRRRRSSFIDGVGADAAHIAQSIASHLAQAATVAA